MGCDNRNDPNRADDCDPDLCRLPECFCSVSGREIPGGLSAEDVPQMIMLSFDDAINNNNMEIFNQLLNGKLKNPNGCDIKATFFVSHRYNNYSMAQELYRRGHEMATHSITHDNEEKYWDNGTEDNWAAEMGGARDLMVKWGNIPAEDIYGSRAPLLRLGGNRQYSALEQEGFVYDSSMVAPLSNPPFWPYPLAFSAPHRCHGNFQVCPTRSHNILTHNFIRHYEQNRAPMGLFLHAAWLKKQPEMLDALQFWLDEVLATYNDVYLVTMSQVLAWMQSPVDNRQAVKLPAWRDRCTALDTEDTCQVSNNCQLASPALGGIKQRLQTCNSCPAYYPWLNDVKGEGFGSDFGSL